ncbi:MAG: FG-GAP-like repeat-containing protein [Chitinophagales bacterium]
MKPILKTSVFWKFLSISGLFIHQIDHVYCQAGNAPDLTYTYAILSKNNVLPVGDLNLDGYDDVIIADKDYTSDGISHRGKMELYLGGIDGLALSPAMTILGDSVNIYLGQKVMSGDFNMDGLPDLAIASGSGSLGKGIFWIYLQTPGGFNPTADLKIYGEQSFSYFGVGSCVGDINGDGYTDLIVSAIYFDGLYAECGKIYIYRGSPSGLHATPEVAISGNALNTLLGDAIATCDVNGDGYDDIVAGYRIGYSLRVNLVYNGSEVFSTIPSDTLWYSSGIDPYLNVNLGDINGDGYEDLLTSSDAGSFEDVAVLQYGSPSGIKESRIFYTKRPESGSAFGKSTASLGDVNGDGFSDFVIGEPYADISVLDAGRVVVYYGENGLNLSVDPDWTYRNYTASEKMGYKVYGLGDINGDGFDDLAVGFYNLARLYVFLGSENGYDKIGDMVFEGSKINASFGYSLDALGDSNNDGVDDIVVGSPGSYPSYPGNGVFIGLGSDIGSFSSYTIFDTGYPNNGSVVTQAGDINADGKNDLLVGGYRCSSRKPYLYYNSGSSFGLDSVWVNCHYNYTSQPYGISICSAGDINNDGFGDFLVGGITSKLAENFPLGSSVRLFYGNVDFVQLDTTITSIADDSLVWVNAFDQDSCELGRAVASLGDINADGYDDFVISAPGFDDGELNEGAVYMYYGAADTVSHTPFWTFESNQIGGRAGYSIATKGDFNGDGYNDLLIGAPFFDNGEVDEGVVFVFYGTALGFLATPSMILEIDQAGANFGNSVDVIGDFNGDGFADAVVGASHYSNGQVNEGGIFIYLGSALGLSSSYTYMEESDQANAQLGFAVSSAGDYNHDGLADVIAGAPYFNGDRTASGMITVIFGKMTDCPMPSTPVSDFVTTSSIHVTWTGIADASGYTIWYKPTTATDWESLETIYSEGEIIGLEPCTEYEIYIQTYCGADLGDPSPSLFAMTNCICATAPIGLFSDNLTPSTAKLHWDADPDATKYKVYYKITGGAWIKVNATANVKNLTGLIAGQTYIWKVKTICPMGLQSPFSSLSNFTLPTKTYALPDSPEVHIFPNPASAELTISLSNFSDSDVLIKIIDIAGQEVNAYHYFGSGDYVIKQLPASGIYFIQVTQDSFYSVSKLIMQ